MGRRQNQTAVARVRRAASRDHAVPEQGREKTRRVDFGLALLREVYAQPGVRYTRQEIATWAGCTDVAIYKIERKARAKVYRALGVRLR